MIIQIDDNKLIKTNVSVPEILILKTLEQHDCLSEILESMQKSGYIDGFSNDNITFLSMTNTGKMLLDRLTNNDSKEISEAENTERLTKIAKAMRNLYPDGMKPDEMGRQTVYPWRGSVTSIAERLRKFEKMFNRTLDLDDVVEATQRYVMLQEKKDPILHKEMRLLKYFIYKDGESDLLEYLDTDIGEDTFDETNGMTLL